MEPRSVCSATSTVSAPRSPTSDTVPVCETGTPLELSHRAPEPAFGDTHSAVSGLAFGDRSGHGWTDRRLGSPRTRPQATRASEEVAVRRSQR